MAPKQAAQGAIALRPSHGTKKQVYLGEKEHTRGYLRYEDVRRVKDNKIVSSKVSLQSIAKYNAPNSFLKNWNACAKDARLFLGVVGFVPMSKDPLPADDIRRRLYDTTCALMRDRHGVGPWAGAAQQA